MLRLFLFKFLLHTSPVIGEGCVDIMGDEYEPIGAPGDEKAIPEWKGEEKEKLGVKKSGTNLEEKKSGTNLKEKKSPKAGSKEGSKKNKKDGGKKENNEKSGDKAGKKKKKGGKDGDKKDEKKGDGKGKKEDKDAKKKDTKTGKPVGGAAIGIFVVSGVMFAGCLAGFILVASHRWMGATFIDSIALE